jgi:CHASE2 domain-containing sensor protein
MDEADARDGGAQRAFAVAAFALAGLAFSLTPVAERLDALVLDSEWSVLRKVAPRPAPDDIVIVGIDEATIRAVPQPIGVWNEPLGEVLVRIASAKPRAMALDVALPDRSFDTLHPGLDRALLVGLAAARDNGPFVASLSIDARTRSARPVYPPYLAVLADEHLGIDLLARDVDGVTRRFSLLIPTEDGGFPTLAGRLCRALSKDCDDGLIDFALGPAFRSVPFERILHTRDTRWLEEQFRGRIVMIGETGRYADRISIPVNLAGWEAEQGTSPGIVVHAQSLRTALTGTAARTASRPAVMVLVAMAAMLAFRRNWRAGAALTAAGILALAGASLASLRGGMFLPISAACGTAALAWATSAALAWRSERARRKPTQLPSGGP